eukprot:TRINITY_DN8529_c1_g1_i5.p1 TRINITY_DN8529_c1_g1~~TRINITY_DN8529_c1_g1_i5.p1  ORF type:complete len:239 (-),score=32.87 TRINITY_DN8529_c1_g1_i5:19-735(-)
MRTIPSRSCTPDEAFTTFATFDPFLYLPTSYLTTPHINEPGTLPSATNINNNNDNNNNRSVMAFNNAMLTSFKISTCPSSISRGRKYYTSQYFSEFAFVCAWERSPGEIYRGLFSENCKVFSDLDSLISHNLGALVAYRKVSEKDNPFPSSPSSRFVYEVETVLDFVLQSPAAGKVMMLKNRYGHINSPTQNEHSLESFSCVGVLAPVPRADLTSTYKLDENSMIVVKEKNGAIIWMI